MSNSALHGLNGRFEIGGHTMDHASLTEVTRSGFTRQVMAGKAALEQQLGHAIPRFCYPRGKWNKRVRETLMQAGFIYARTIENFMLDCGKDRFSIPTSIQIFPHGKQVLLRNYARYGHYLSRFNAITSALRNKNWTDLLIKLIEPELDEDSVLHIWGYSWKIEEQKLWIKFGRIFFSNCFKAFSIMQLKF